MHFGYLHYSYSNIYFDTSFDFLADSFFYSHGISYVESFLLTFFRWRWLGVLILFLPVLGVYIISRKILSELNLNSLKRLAFLPAITLMISQHFVHFYMQKSLVVLLMLTIICFHIILRDNKFRYLLLLGFFIPLFLLSKLELALLCFTLLCIEFFVSGDKRRYFLSVVYLILTILFAVFYFVKIPVTPLFIVEMPILIGIQLALVLLFVLLSKFEKQLNLVIIGWKRNVLFILIFGMLGASFVSNKELETKELYARLDMALLDNDFDEILSLTKNQKIEKEENFYPYVFYALAQKGQLAKSLFQYEVNTSNFLSEALPLHTNSTTLLTICFYKNLGLLNEAIHQAFQLGISLERGNCFRSMCMLVDLNIEKGEVHIAEKLLKKLDYTIVHKDFIQSRREMIKIKSKSSNTDFDKYLYINKDQFLNISYALFLAEKDSRFVKDYFLCSLLLSGEYPAFCSSYGYMFSYNCKDRVYAEALVMARDMGIYNSQFIVPDRVEQSWYNFKLILGNQWITSRERERRFSSFRNTWWYYYLKKQGEL